MLLVLKFFFLNKNENVKKNQEYFDKKVVDEGKAKYKQNKCCNNC